MYGLKKKMLREGCKSIQMKQKQLRKYCAGLRPPGFGPTVMMSDGFNIVIYMYMYMYMCMVRLCKYTYLGVVNLSALQRT